MDYVHRSAIDERPAFDFSRFTLMGSRPSATVISGTAPTRIDRDVHTQVIRNDLGVPILVLLRDLGGDASTPMLDVRIAARSSVRLPRHSGHLLLDRFEAIARDVGMHAAAVPGTDDRTRADAIATMQAALEQGPHQWPEPRERVVLATELAHLLLVASADSVAAMRRASDGIRYRLQSYLSDSGMRPLPADAEIGIDDRVESMFTSAREVMDGVSTNLDGVRAVLRELIPIVDREAAYHAAFESAVALQLDQMVPCGVTAAEPVSVAGTAERIAVLPPAVTDVIEIEAEAAAGLSVLLGEVSYTRDLIHPVIFRRCAGTNRWLGRLCWPSCSSEGQIRVRPPGGWTWTDVPGRITTGRRCLSLLQVMLDAYGSA